MCVSPDSGRIRMFIATSTLLHRRHDLRELERHVTHRVTQVTQICKALCFVGDAVESRGAIGTQHIVEAFFAILSVSHTN